MKIVKRFAGLVKTTYNKVYDYDFKVGAKMRPEHFTRERKMSFVDTFLMILKGTKRSLQLSIDFFIREAKLTCGTYSKQAFSQRRQNIKPEAFLDLFNHVTETYYMDYKYQTYRGYRVSAIDGICYNLPNTEELLNIYGGDKHNGIIPQVQAQGSCLMDVLNGVLMDVLISPYLTNERKLAEKHLERFEKLGKAKELILMDRGYPSKALIQQLNKRELNFLIRCPKNGFIREIRNCSNEDEIITYRHEGQKAKLRVLSIILENGHDEILITNIFDVNFSITDFKYLYRLRWEIETRFNDIKNKLQIENFSGNTPIAVLQDFYATMFLSNMAAFALLDSEDELKKIPIAESVKYEYATNISMVIGTLKIEFIDLFTEDSDRKRDKRLNKVMQNLLKSTVPIRSNRSLPRFRKHHTLKFHSNLKSL